MVTAVLNDDIELQNDLKEEYADLMAEYKKELEDLWKKLNAVHFADIKQTLYCTNKNCSDYVRREIEEGEAKKK